MTQASSGFGPVSFRSLWFHVFYFTPVCPGEVYTWDACSLLRSQHEETGEGVTSTTEVAHPSPLKAVSTAAMLAFPEALSLFPQSVKHVRTSLNPCWGRSCWLRCGGQQKSWQRSQRLTKGWGKEGRDVHGRHRAHYDKIGAEHQWWIMDSSCYSGGNLLCF